MLHRATWYDAAASSDRPSRPADTADSAIDDDGGGGRSARPGDGTRSRSVWARAEAARSRSLAAPEETNPANKKLRTLNLWIT